MHAALSQSLVTTRLKGFANAKVKSLAGKMREFYLSSIRGSMEMSIISDIID